MNQDDIQTMPGLKGSTRDSMRSCLRAIHKLRDAHQAQLEKLCHEPMGSDIANSVADIFFSELAWIANYKTVIDHRGCECPAEELARELDSRFREAIERLTGKPWQTFLQRSKGKTTQSNAAQATDPATPKERTPEQITIEEWLAEARAARQKAIDDAAHRANERYQNIRLTAEGLIGKELAEKIDMKVPAYCSDELSPGHYEVKIVPFGSVPFFLILCLDRLGRWSIPTDHSPCLVPVPLTPPGMAMTLSFGLKKAAATIGDALLECQEIERLLGERK